MDRKSFPFEYAPGATPLDPDETNGLIPDYISTQGELNALEQENILEATAWATARKHKHLFTDTFLMQVHKRMLKDVWRWAGQYRLSDKSIGIAWQRIPVEIKNLLEDTRYWAENQTYPWDELGARFHHRLVSIHAFPNGNGRHARLATDVILKSYGQPVFSWGANSFDGQLDRASSIRQEYIAALQEADQRKYSRLICFVRM
ncbi:MAG: mobile mystery protein B [Oligoflexus sp.]